MTKRRHGQQMLWRWCLLLTLVGVMGVGGRLFAEDRKPTITVPPLPAPPTPNAADYYKQAYDELYKLAAKTTIGQPLWDISDPKRLQQYTPEQREAYLAELAPAAKLIREGHRYRFASPEMLELIDNQPHPSVFPALRELTRYLNFESETHIASGNWEAGMSSALAGLHLGADCMQDGTLISVLVGAGITQSALKNAWESVDHLNASQALTAITRLQEIMAHEHSLAEVLTTQKIIEQRYILKSLEQPNWRDEFQTKTPVQLNDGIKDLFDPYTKEMDQRITEAEKPYPLRRTLPTPQNPVVAVFFPAVTESIGYRLAQHQAQERLLLLACALRAYCLEHTAYPDTLQALVPSYLPKLLVDPFAPNGAFGYQRNEAGYVLYSFGPDCTDDGGQPINGPIGKKSVGDIVAGRNQ